MLKNNTTEKKNFKDQLIDELRQELRQLRWESLRQRLEIEILTERPQGRAAGKIRRKYQRRRERFLTIKN